VVSLPLAFPPITYTFLFFPIPAVCPAVIDAATRPVFLIFHKENVMVEK
jgi:hypothetical protein